MTPQDFSEDASFRAWVFTQRPDDARYWIDYLRRHPDQRDSADEARRFLLSVRGELPVVSDEQIQDAVGQLMGQVRAVPVLRVRLRNRWPVPALAVAGLLLLLAGLLGWQQYQMVYSNRTAATGKPIRQLVADQTDIVNQQKTARLIKLPDGSLVVLQPNARLRFIQTFARRDVHLTGMAFFEVVKNHRRPFRVITHALTTEVLGTSFSVNAPATGGLARVIVKTGRVLVSPSRVAGEQDKPAEQTLINPTRNTSQTVVLLPNQQATFSPGDTQVAKSTVPGTGAKSSTPVVATSSFRFRRTPLPVVFATLEQAYGISIQFDRNTLTNCSLTARLDEGTLLDKLDIIASSTGSSYALRDGRLIIHSTGCR